MPSKKKNILKQAKQQVKVRRESILRDMSVLIKERENILDAGSEEYADLSNRIAELFNEVKELDEAVANKGKKSKNIVWRDEDFTPSPKKKASNAEIVNDEAYSESLEKSITARTGPIAKWLKPGILVKKRGSEMVGLVMDIKQRYATVLFGGCETNVRSLSLRPADWEK